MTPSQAAEAALSELVEARTRFADMHSPHEGYAVILEELDELWAQIKHDKRPGEQRRQDMQREATQLAAMTLRFLVDCC